MKMSSNSSVILSWSYDDQGNGVVIMGEKDPLGIEQRIKPIRVWQDEVGISILKELDIDID